MTSLPGAGGEADAPTFFVFYGILPHFSPLVNYEFLFFPRIFQAFPVILTLYLPLRRPVNKKEVPHMEERKNTKNEQNTNEQNTPNTNKNAKNTKNTKNCK